MRKFVLLIFSLMLIISHLKADSIEDIKNRHFKEHIYDSKDVDPIISKLGVPTYDGINTVNRGYEFLTEAEPDYSLYFSRSEWECGVRIRHMIWDSEDSHTELWAKFEKEKWVVFYSYWHDDSVQF